MANIVTKTLEREDNTLKYKCEREILNVDDTVLQIFEEFGQGMRKREKRWERVRGTRERQRVEVREKSKRGKEVFKTIQVRQPKPRFLAVATNFAHFKK